MSILCKGLFIYIFILVALEEILCLEMRHMFELESICCKRALKFKCPPTFCYINDDRYDDSNE